MSDGLLHDTRALAEQIGPRGSCTEGEELALDYVADRLAQMGYEPMAHTFESVRSAWMPLVLSSALGLLSAGLFIALPSRAADAVALVLVLAVLWSTVRELGHRSSALRWFLPRSPSRNVIAVAPPAGEVRRRVLITSHVDTHRTPLVHSSTGWISVFRRMIPVGVGALALLAVLMGMDLIRGPGSESDMAFRLLALAPVAVLIPINLLALQAETTEFSHGANDNASGVSVLLSVAERLAERPLAQTEVWLAATGCQEVGNYGVTALLRDLAEPLGDAVLLVVDKVGCTGPYYLTAERRFGTYRYDPDLIAQAQAVAADHPHLAVRPGEYKETFTEGVAGVLAGRPTLVILGLDLTGGIPYLHHSEDTVDKINPDVLRRTDEFVRQWLRWHDVRAEET